MLEGESSGKVKWGAKWKCKFLEPFQCSLNVISCEHGVCVVQNIILYYIEYNIIICMFKKNNLAKTKN